MGAAGAARAVAPHTGPQAQARPRGLMEASLCQALFDTAGARLVVAAHRVGKPRVRVGVHEALGNGVERLRARRLGQSEGGERGGWWSWLRELGCALHT